MHIGRRYKVTQFLGWTRWEVVWLLGWSVLVTALLQFSQWHFLTTPTPVLTIVGSALAIILAFKNQQCYARFHEALVLAGQINTASLNLANKLTSTVGILDSAESSARLKGIFYRHFAWLTALRFFLRDRKSWENTLESGNVRFLAKLPSPESQSVLKDELKAYLSASDVRNVVTHQGDKEALLLHWQYEAVSEIYREKLISEYILIVLTNALDELARLQGALKRIKNYPYARNYYSIAIILVKAFVSIVPFSLFPYVQELGKYAGIEQWTVWLNVPFSVLVSWIFIALEKVGENSSNPFEGGSNDVPISSTTRRIEIEMRTMLGEETELRPLEAKFNILF